VSVGLPDFEDTLLFPTAQTYDKSVGDSGNTVNWVEQTPAGGPEPEHPAPSVTLTASSGDGHGSATPTTDKATTAVSLPHDVATSSDVDSAKTVSYVALGVGIVGLIVAIAALVLGRKRPGPAA
jgi:hypothetical protein